MVKMKIEKALKEFELELYRYFCKRIEEVIIKNRNDFDLNNCRCVKDEYYNKTEYILFYGNTFICKGVIWIESKIDINPEKTSLTLKWEINK